jgi:hypothetical protein
VNVIIGIHKDELQITVVEREGTVPTKKKIVGESSRAPISQFLQRRQPDRVPDLPTFPVNMIKVRPTFARFPSLLVTTTFG